MMAARRWIGIALAVAVAVAGCIYFAQNGQIAVWSFEPSTAVEKQTARLPLTDRGKFIYYTGQPEILPPDKFNAVCPKLPGFGILGCYSNSQNKIYIYDVTDPRLDGAEESTAAHEMLHAAWKRLDGGERARLTPLLEAEAGKLDLKALLKSYTPDRRINEIHSLVGTRIPAIGDELEAYYSQYFLDRAVVTGLYERSERAIRDLSARAWAIVDEINAAQAAGASAKRLDALDAELAKLNAGVVELERGLNLWLEDG